MGIFVMELLAKWTIWRGDKERTIELFRADLAKLAQEHAVELLVLSAFANDWVQSGEAL